MSALLVGRSFAGPAGSAPRLPAPVLRSRRRGTACQGAQNGKPRRCLSNSSQEDIAKAPTWKDTLSGAIFWANPNHWDKAPESLYWMLSFMLLKVVGTVGGYRGRAAFARRSGLRPLLKRRAEAAAVVEGTFDSHVDRFPETAKRVAGSGGFSGKGLVVVLPVFSRTEQDVEELRQTLASLAWQTRVPDAVVLVDDGSPADLSPAFAAWPEAATLACVRMLRNTGPAGARSVGLRLLRRWAGGRGLVVCLTDSDAAPENGWCEAMVEAQAEAPGIYSGPTLSATECHTGRFHDHFGNLNGRWTWDDPRGVLLYGCTCNVSVDLETLGDLEFDPVFERPGFEDIELCWRARREKGVMTRYCEKARVYHEYDRGLIGLYKQFWKYGHTEPIMAWMHPDFSFQGSRPVTAGFGSRDPRQKESSRSPAVDAAARGMARFLDDAVRSFGKFSQGLG